MNSTCGLIVNSSRGIIYVDKTEKICRSCTQCRQGSATADGGQLKGVINA